MGRENEKDMREGGREERKSLCSSLPPPCFVGETIWEMTQGKSGVAGGDENPASSPSIVAVAVAVVVTVVAVAVVGGVAGGGDGKRARGEEEHLHHKTSSCLTPSRWGSRNLPLRLLPPPCLDGQEQGRQR